MPFRTWMHIAAFGIATIASEAAGQEVIEPTERPPVEQSEPETEASPADSQNRPEDNEQKTEELPAPPPLVTDAKVGPVSSDTEPAQSGNASKDEPDDLGRRDLAAQESMAESTRQMMKATWISVFLTFLGVLLIWRTLVHTRVAANAAKDTVTQAKKSTDAAIKAAEAAALMANNERAWIFFDTIRPGNIVEMIIDGKFEQLRFSMAIRWKNVGRNPATQIGLTVSHKLIASGAPIPHFHEEIPPEDAGGVFGPGAAFETNPQIVGQDDFMRLKANEMRMIIYSLVTYRSPITSNVVHQSEFCGEVDFFGEVIQNGERVPKVGVRPIGPQNTAT